MCVIRSVYLWAGSLAPPWCVRVCVCAYFRGLSWQDEWHHSMIWLCILHCFCVRSVEQVWMVSFCDLIVHHTMICIILWSDCAYCIASVYALLNKFKVRGCISLSLKQRVLKCVQLLVNHKFMNDLHHSMIWLCILHSFCVRSVEQV